MKQKIFSLNIYRMEIRRNFKSFLIWIVSICGILFFGMLFFPAINTGDLLEQIAPIFETPMLKAMLSAFGAELSNLGSLMGFYVTYNSFYNILLGCIFASVLAGNLLAKEEAEKTAEFLFTKPVTRLNIFLSKTAVLLTYIALLTVLFFLTSILAMEAVKADAHRQLDISKEDRSLITTQINKYPDRIYEAFNLGEDSFTDYSLNFASDLMRNNPAELEEFDLDINDMNKLLSQAMESPEDFFQSALENPEDYMSMFSMQPDQREEFLEHVRAEREEFRIMKENFYNSPDLFLRFFDENPGLALSQFTSVDGSMSKMVSLLELPQDFETRVFKKYNIRKLAIFSVYIFLLLISVGTIVLFISLLFKRGASILGFAVGFVLFLYFLKSITSLSSGFSQTAKMIGFISPFAWIDTDILSLDYNFICWRVLLFTVVSAASLIAAAFRLSRKDILI